ncbi:hypothetical protein, partial [Xylella fastidiosa]|uniref:hypothetical protein n=1 Tax=Xylella fastidiosa TaxID=2371 RepID=UPI001396B602
VSVGYAFGFEVGDVAWGKFGGLRRVWVLKARVTGQAGEGGACRCARRNRKAVAEGDNDDEEGAVRSEGSGLQS